MVEDSLEDIIKKKLDDHEEFYDSTSWEQLASKMDQVDATAEDSAFEDIKEQLNQHKEPIIESHWQLLKAELEALEQRRYRLWATKSIEAITLLLLIWTYTNVSSFIAPKSQYQPTIEADYAMSNLEQAEGSLLSVVDHSKTTLALLDSEKTVSNSVDEGAISNDPKAFLELRQLAVLEIQELYVDRSDLSQGLGHIDVSAGLNDIDLSSIDVFEIEPLYVSLSHAHPYSDIAPISIDQEKSFKNRNDGWWIGAGISEDINLINSGFNFGYLRSQVNSGLVGASANVSISWQRGPIEIQSGLEYGQKGFSPGLLRTFTKASANSYLENQLDLIEFQQVQVPLMVKLHGLNKSKNHLYGFVGVSANAILGYTYSIQKSVQPSTRVNALDLEPQIDLTELPTGFVQGGTLKTNSYLTGVVGFGFESRISNKVSFYLQPQYQHQLAGTLNEYVNKINSISIETGLKIRF